MPYKIGDTCYIVTHCDVHSQFEDCVVGPAKYAQQIKVLEVLVTDVEKIFIKRNGNTRMQYQVEAVNKAHIYDVRRTSSYRLTGNVWYDSALYPTIEEAEKERQRQLKEHLKHSVEYFNQQLECIKKLITK